MHRVSRLLVGFVVVALSLGVAHEARADASAWLFGGGGISHWKQGDGVYSDHGLLSFDAGVGTTPDGLFIVGGLLRMEPILGSGTDLAGLARVASHGFQSGSFGAALDIGGYLRFWGEGSQGLMADITLGGPLGLQISAQTTYGTDKALGFAGVAGVDLLRLTVYRQNMLDWWPNPKPAQHRTASR
jgi:hypothetical protein